MNWATNVMLWWNLQNERYREKNRIAREEALALNGGDPRDSESEQESVDEANRTPSPVEQGAEHSLKIGEERRATH